MNKIPSLYVVSATKSSIGKTSLCLGLALKFRDEEINIGYFKPLGWHTSTHEGKPLDEDTLHMKKILKLEEPLELITPVLLNYQYLDQYSHEDKTSLLKKVSQAYKQIAKDKDIIIIEALEPCLGSYLNLCAIDLAKTLRSQILLLSTTIRDTAVDEILFQHVCMSKMETKCKGVIFNRVERTMYNRMKDVVAPFLKDQGIPVFGLIPESTALTAPTVEELVKALNGKVLCGKENLSNLVERYLIGAMTHDSAIRYFRRAPRKAVITGGDRPDISLLALETNTSALILTGNFYPDVRVLARAEEKGVPIILVSYDTYTAVEKIRDVTGKIKYGDTKRIDEVKRLVSNYVNWKALLSSLMAKT